MRLNQILMFAFANTPIMRERRIKDLYAQMEQSMADLNDADASAKTATQRAYLKAFMNVMDRMSKQLWDAKEKYRNLDKQKLKDQKCQKLAEEIKIFREQCYITRSRLEKVKLQLKQQKLKQDLFNRQKQALLKNLQKASQNKKQNRNQCSKLKSFIQQQSKQSQNGNRFFKDKQISMNTSLQKRTKNKTKKSQTNMKKQSRYKNSFEMNDKELIKRKRPQSTANYYYRSYQQDF